jgi:hypothetical protein
MSKTSITQFVDNLVEKVKPAKPPKPTKKVHLWVFLEGLDEPIRKIEHMDQALSKPIKPGFRRKCSIATDEPVDKQVDGKYARSENVDGDSTPPTVLDESTSQLIQFWVNGDGAIGKKIVRVIVDAHVGEGDVALTLDISYEVASADATAFSDFKEIGADEAIPS